MAQKCGCCFRLESGEGCSVVSVFPRANHGAWFWFYVPIFLGKKKACKGQGRKWKLLLYCSVVCLFLWMTPVPSCCALICPCSCREQLLELRGFQTPHLEQILLQSPQAAPPPSLSLKHGSAAGKPLTWTLFLPQGINIPGRGSVRGGWVWSAPSEQCKSALERLHWVFSMPAARLGSCFSRCCFLRKWVNAWWLEWCGKKAYLCEALANCLARVTERCSKFPDFAIATVLV